MSQLHCGTIYRNAEYCTPPLVQVCARSAPSRTLGMQEFSRRSVPRMGKVKRMFDLRALGGIRCTGNGRTNAGDLRAWRASHGKKKLLKKKLSLTAASDATPSTGENVRRGLNPLAQAIRNWVHHSIYYRASRAPGVKFNPVLFQPHCERSKI